MSTPLVKVNVQKKTFVSSFFENIELPLSGLVSQDEPMADLELVNGTGGPVYKGLHATTKVHGPDIGAVFHVDGLTLVNTQKGMTLIDDLGVITHFVTAVGVFQAVAEGLGLVVTHRAPDKIFVESADDNDLSRISVYSHHDVHMEIRGHYPDLPRFYTVYAFAGRLFKEA